jgi:hypothetical protein
MDKFTHGLIVVDPKNIKDDMLDILHFVGYWGEPTSRDVESLRLELRDDETFGLQDVWDQLEILPAPEEVVAEYIQLFDDES